MINRTIYVPQHRWTFRVYIAVTCYWSEEILGHLWRLGAPLEVMASATQNLACGNLDNGLTYASPGERETLMVVARTTTAAEMFNSVVHEIDHATMFTFPLLGITPGTEEAAYFKGGLGRDIFPMVQPYLCDHCRQEHAKIA